MKSSLNYKKKKIGGTLAARAETETFSPSVSVCASVITGSYFEFTATEQGPRSREAGGSRAPPPNIFKIISRVSKVSSAPLPPNIESLPVLPPPPPSLISKLLRGPCRIRRGDGRKKEGSVPGFRLRFRRASAYVSIRLRFDCSLNVHEDSSVSCSISASASVDSVSPA